MSGINRIAMLNAYQPRQIQGSQNGIFGDNVATTDQLATIMDNVIEEMNRDVTAALLKVDTLSWTDDQAHNARQGLTSLRGVIARMTMDRADVLNGSEDINKWLTAATTVAAGIQQQERLWGEDTIFNHLSDTIADAYNRIKAPFLQPTNWALIIGGAVVLIGGFLWLSRPVIKVRSINGYKRRKRS